MLTQQGGGGGQQGIDQTYWVSPLPPDGPVTFVLAWPGFGLPESQTVVDGGAMRKRAEQAGMEHLHPHQFWHTMAHQWLANGGQETDLMRIMGWKSRQMVERYAASAADERAREAHRRMQLGDRI